MELGNKLSKLFKELYSQFSENGYLPAELIAASYNNEKEHEIEFNSESHEKGYNWHRGENGNVVNGNGFNGIVFNGNSFNGNENNGHGDDRSSDESSESVKKQKRKGEKKDIPVLDKMMKNDLEKLHLYGQHKFRDIKHGEPLNNVNL